MQSTCALKLHNVLPTPGQCPVQTMSVLNHGSCQASCGGGGGGGGGVCVRVRVCYACMLCH